jgi:hypothetical protein
MVMASHVEVSSDIAPLSLYIALNEQTRGDLEVISRAAIAWSKMIREAAFVVDPSLEVRVELVSGTEGSINLNSLIRVVRDIAGDRQRLTAIALGVAMYFGAQAGGWVVGKGYDALWDYLRTHIGHETVGKMTPAETQQVEEIVQRIMAAKSVQERAAQVYTELPKDSNVVGVGVSLQPGERPAYIVPRDSFADRAGVKSVVEEVVSRRTETDTVTLALVAPVLSEGDYKWKFLFGTKTIWALMDDPDFKARLSPGSNSAPRMTAGIQLVVDLETVQEMQNGVWVIMSQRIIKVRNLQEPPRQASWLDSPSEGQ